MKRGDLKIYRQKFAKSFQRDSHGHFLPKQSPATRQGERIREVKEEKRAEAAGETPPPPSHPVEVTPYPRLGDEAAKYGGRNLDFEEKLGAEAPESEQAEPETPALAEEDFKQYEIKMIADVLKLPFAYWSARVGIRAIRLTDIEAAEWAEPTKMLLDHYVPKMPPIAYAWLAWSVTTITVMNKRFELIEAARERKTEARPAEQTKTVQPVGGGVQQQGAPPYEAKRI